MSIPIFRKSLFSCPICGYYGHFKVFRKRRHAMCPGCGSLERHRLQCLVFQEISGNLDTKKMRMLHFAPEPFFTKIFGNLFGTYLTADLNATNVDRKEDLTKMSFPDNSFDFFFASHVLEHIKDDLKALSEIKRVLSPGGIAIIPVPTKAGKTIEYLEPNARECHHVRRPGEDYYERYKDYFTEVRFYRSCDFDGKYQNYVYEGSRHPSTVPVCYR